MADAAQLLKAVTPGGAATAVAATAAEAVAERLAGRRPSAVRALFVATATGVGTGVGMYKLLRSGGDADESQNGSKPG